MQMLQAASLALEYLGETIKGEYKTLHRLLCAQLHLVKVVRDSDLSFIVDP